MNASKKNLSTNNIMKTSKCFTFFLIVNTFLYNSFCLAQTDEIPLSKRYNLSDADVPILFYNFDVKREVEKQDSINPMTKCGGRYFIYNLNLNKICKTDTIEGTRVIKRVKFAAINANRLNVNFYNSHLGFRSIIYSYGTNKDSKIRTLDNSRNNEERVSGGEVKCDTLILELNEPINNIDSNIIFIESVDFGYLESSLNNGRSIVQDFCLLDINCNYKNIEIMIQSTFRSKSKTLPMTLTRDNNS